MASGSLDASVVPLLFRKRQRVSRLAARQYVGTDGEIEISSGAELEVSKRN